MEQIVLEARAKLNLSLDIVGRREDGYHLLEMVMQSISLSDRITIQKADTLSLSCDKAGIPLDESNIAIKAAKAFFSALGTSFGAKIHVEKRIPSEAGMGGGSADGAAVLYGLNLLYDAGFSLLALQQIGLSVGADVPFCLQGGTAFVSGIGEQIKPLPPLSDVFFAVVKPKEGVSTKLAFSRFDHLCHPSHPNTQAVIPALFRKDLPAFCKETGNVLEEAAALPQVEEIKKRLLEYGAMGAWMTGSGSAVFGLFSKEETARTALRHFSEEWYLCTPKNEGIAILS